MKTIKYKKEDVSIADNAFITKLIIRDKKPVKKQGLTDYWIEAFRWYGERVVVARIETSWIGEYYHDCETLRDASSWIKNKLCT